jgi:hypothetical protein
LFTGASLVAAINSILGGDGLAVLAARVAALEDGAALTVGAVLALVLFVLHLLYQQRPCRASALAGPTETGSPGGRGLRSSGAEAELAVPVLR